MAKFIVPSKAIGFRKLKNNKFVMLKTGKYHLMKSGNDPATHAGFTGCNLIVWDEDMFSDIDVDRSDAYEIVDVADISADRLCKKCTGPLIVMDS